MHCYPKFVFILLLAFLISACTDSADAPATPRPVSVTALPATAIEPPIDEGCPLLVREALEGVNTACAATARNEVCYGSRALEADPVSSVEALRFENPGDIVPFNDIVALRLSAMDSAADIWGVALMRLQANLPDTTPGQNVTFLLFGDTQLENREGQVNSFYFQSSINDARCAEAPESGMLIQTPDGADPVSFSINDVALELNATIYLQAQPGAAMTLNVLEGEAAITADESTQRVTAGNAVTVSLDKDGAADGEPTAPEAFTEREFAALPVDNLDTEAPAPVMITPVACTEETAETPDIGDLVSGAIDAPGEMDVYQFTVETAQELYFASLGREGSAEWRLEDASGTIIFDNTGLWQQNDPGLHTLDAGTYCIFVQSTVADTGGYEFRFWHPVEAESFNITVGDSVSENEPERGAGRLEVPGAEDMYTLTLTEEQDVMFGAFGSEGDIHWTLMDAEGDIIFENEGLWSGNDPGAFTLAAGDYTLRVMGTGDDTGAYAFRLWELLEPEMFNLEVGDRVSEDTQGAGSGHIEAAGAGDIYTLNLPEAQSVFFAALGEGEDASIQWRLEDDTGAPVFEEMELWAGNDPGAFELVSGTYRIIVTGIRGSSGTYVFELRTEE